MVAALLAWMNRADVRHVVAVACLVAARLAPIVWFSPLFGLRTASATVRTGLHLAATIALAPIAVAAVPLGSFPWGTPWLALAIVREVLLGAVFAVVSAAPAFALDVGGRLVDLHRGANLAEVLAPATGERTSPLADLWLLGTLAAFAALGGLRVAFSVLASTMVELPVGLGPSARGIGPMALEAAHALGYAVALGVAFAAPAAIVLVLAEVVLGVQGRSMPRISTFFVAMPLRAMLGLAMALLVLPAVFEVGVGAFADALAHAGRLLR